MKKLCSVCLILALFVSVFSVIPAEAATANAKGFEVSIADGDVNWNQVKEEGKVNFAILRAYEGSAKDGAFEANYANATAAGVPVGASMVLTAKSTSAAKSQANSMLKALKDKPFPYPILVYIGGTTYASMNKDTVTAIASEALATIQAAKYYVLLYVDYNFYNNNINASALTAYGFCVGASSDNDAYQMRRTSKSGRVAGVTGTVSLFNTYRDFPTIMQNNGLNNVTVTNGNWNGIAWDQRDSYWGYNYIGGGSIYDTACGILSTCNAINYMTGAFPDYASANSFILDWANYAHSINGYNPGVSASGGYRYVMFGTDYSNPPPLEQKYGSKYKFTMPILWTENWNNANWYNGYSYNNVYVNTQTALKNYLANGAVAIAHVPGHFICLADYDPSTDKFLVLDSYDYWTRENVYCDGVEWVSSAKLSGGLPALTVGGYCVLQPTTTVVEPVEQTNKYPYASGNNYMLYDGETTYQVAGDDSTKTNIYLHYEDTQGESSLKMDCTAPTAATNKGGYASQLLKSSVNLSSYKNFGIDVYVPQKLTGTHTLRVGFYSNGSEKGYARISMRDWEAGWHKVAVPASNISGAITAVDALTYTWNNTAKLADPTYFLIDNVRMTNSNIVEEHPNTSVDPEPSQPSTPTVKLGDVNGDTDINAKDALEVLKFAVAKTVLDQTQQTAAEVVGDDDINAKDALEILKYAVGKITQFPIEK